MMVGSLTRSIAAASATVNTICGSGDSTRERVAREGMNLSLHKKRMAVGNRKGLNCTWRTHPPLPITYMALEESASFMHGVGSHPE
jgi:hypothetical protein